MVKTRFGVILNGMGLSIGGGAGRRVAFPYGVFYQVGGLFDAEFSHDIGPMVFHSANTDIQKVGNLLVRSAFGDQFEDFTLAKRQRGGWGGRRSLSGCLYELMGQLAR